ARDRRLGASPVDPEFDGALASSCGTAIASMNTNPTEGALFVARNLSSATEWRCVMAHAFDAGRPTFGRGALLGVRPTHQAYQVLLVGFTALPILAGMDKFFHLLVNWDAYLAPVATRVLPISGHTFMLIVGVIEI